MPLSYLNIGRADIARRPPRDRDVFACDRHTSHMRVTYCLAPPPRYITIFIKINIFQVIYLSR